MNFYKNKNIDRHPSGNNANPSQNNTGTNFHTTNMSSMGKFIKKGGSEGFNSTINNPIDIAGNTKKRFHD